MRDAVVENQLVRRQRGLRKGRCGTRTDLSYQVDPVQCLRWLKVGTALKNVRRNRHHVGNVNAAQGADVSNRVQHEAVAGSSCRRYFVTLDVTCMLLQRLQFHSDVATPGKIVARCFTPDASPHGAGCELFAVFMRTLTVLNGVCSINREIAPIMALGFGHTGTVSKAAICVWIAFLLSGLRKNGRRFSL